MLILIIAISLFGVYLLWNGKIAIAVLVFGAVAGYLIWASRWNRHQAHKMFLVGVRFAAENPGAEFPYDTLGSNALTISAVNLGILASAYSDPESLYDYDEIYAAAKSLHAMASTLERFR